MIDLSKIINNPLADKISALSNFANLASTALDSIMIKPQDSESIKGIAGFLFDMRGRESYRASCDITDHYIENNSTLQDHIALKPETFTVAGFVGEVRLSPPQELKSASAAASKLQALDPFLPSVTAQAKAICNEVERNYNIFRKANETAKNLWDNYNGLLGSVSAPETLQQKAYGYFVLARNTRQVFNIQTPWALLENMVIQDLEIAQQEDTRQITDFSITFKKVNFARTLRSKKKIQERAAVQAQTPVDKGVKKLMQSTLGAGKNYLFGLKV
jgi:hypothetical protein